MDEILELNADYFHSQKDGDVNLICVEKIIKKLQKHKIVKVTGLHHSRKTSTVYEVVNRIGETRNCFYFNSQIYKNSRVGTAKGIVKLIDYAADKRAFDSTSILVFESIEEIKHAKDVISELYQKGKYRIILIGSLKHLHGLPHAKVLPPSIFERIEKRKIASYIDNYMVLGSLHAFDYAEVTIEQKTIRDTLTDSCMFHDVIMSHGVKDIFLYQSALSFMARNIGKYLSLRDITKLINEGNLNTSIITMTDYIQCSLSAGFIHTLKRYDLKKEKKMDSKGSYYFGDLGILASIKKDAPTKKHRLFENLLLLELLQSNYEVFTGMNGKFLFSFYTKKLGEKKCIHVSHQTDKKEIRKEINKLTKIKGKSERYLVVENLEDLGLRKKDYQTVQVVSYLDILEII